MVKTIEKIRQGYISKHNSKLNYYVELHQSTIMIAFVWIVFIHSEQKINSNHMRMC